MGEELNFENILGADEIDNLFLEDDPSVPEDKKDDEDNKKDDITETIDVDNLFTEESGSVGNEETNKEGQDSTTSKDTGASPKTNFYSSIASALREDGALPDLDEETVLGIKTPDDFAEAIEKYISNKLDERQKRIDEALNSGIEPSEIQKYESTIQYLNSITEDALSDESDTGEQLRKRLIYNDFLNRGYSQERATREVKKSFDAGTDIEDAKESLKSNKEFFGASYNNLLSQAKKEAEEEAKQRKKEADDLKKSMLEGDKIFGDLQVDKSIRQKAFEAISKPVYKDPETGELYTAIQKYELDNRAEFLKNIGFLYTLTDGFKNLKSLINGKVNKEIKKGIKELETTINNSSRSNDGTLRFISGVKDDPESYAGKGWTFDV